MALPRCVVSRYATARAESLEGAISGHQSWALLCRCRCRLRLAEVPRGTDRNLELKLRLRLWEAGEVSELISKILGKQHRATQPQTDEQRGKRACALTATGSISKAVKGLVGGAGQRFHRLSKKLDCSPDSTDLGQRNSSHQCRVCQGGAGCLGLWKVLGSARCHGRARRISIASLPHVHLSPIGTPSSPSQGPDRGGACFEDLTFFTIKWAQHAARVLRKRTGPRNSSMMTSGSVR